MRWLLPAVTLTLVACDTPAPDLRTAMTLAEAMATDDTAGYLRATGPRAFTFPDDHGPHPGYRVEWWYFTGNLDGVDGERFGFQLTFFRSAVTPTPAERASDWAADAIWMAHFGFTDAGGEQFHAFERFARGAAGLAGARAEPFRVFVEDWSVASVDPAATFPVHLRAADGGIVLDLRLQQGRDIVLQGDGGLSAKGPERGNASYYYSLTRMPAQGFVERDGERLAVSGEAWMDREWSTSALGPNLVGWDWFALQLDDGRDLMLYQLRRADGSADSFSAGVLVEQRRTVRLDADDFRLSPDGYWTSPIEDVRWPVRWRVHIPDHGIDLRVTPVLEDQELDLTVRYWEGAVDVGGTHTGRGYLEMTGYAETGDGPARGEGR